MIRNNVTRLLDARRIPYKVYELPGDKIGALEAAAIMGIPPAEVFKTIVILRDEKKKPILALVPAGSEVDLKLVARETGEKKVHLATERQAETITGLQAGGISPLALIQRGYEVLIDESAQALGEINVSGGQRGINIRLEVSDLLKLTKARFANLKD
jgi:Cys-tRNA(Pro)/Cys-tRNA(Cys) deacylase